MLDVLIMQCVNCHFENMPGLEACCRCGTSLRLATAAIGVHPPRAGRWAKRWRRLFPFVQRLRFQGVARLQSLALDFVGKFPKPEIANRLLIPGWPQIYSGRRAFGRTLLGAWLASMFAGLASYGSPLCQILWGVALTCHAITIIDVVWDACSELRERLAQIIWYGIVAAVCVYTPTGWLLSRVVIVQVFNLNVAPFQAGDVILCRPNSSLAPGDVVLYDMPSYRITRPGLAILIRGSHFDRILAVGGDRVVWENQSLTVNGRPSPWRPLNPQRIVRRFQATIPVGTVLILPSTTVFGRRGQVDYGDAQVLNGVPDLDFQNLCVINESLVQGKVIWQTWPLSRFGRPSTWSE